MKHMKKWLAALAMLTLFGAAHAADAVLGPGDVLKISVYGSPDLATDTRVSDAGTITFPLLGPVEVNGLTASGAESKISSLLESGGFVRKPQVNILITQIQNQQVSVIGQINRPGRYPIEGKRTVLDMLAVAGGISADGGDTVALIRKRNGTTTREVIDIIGMVRSGELSSNIEVSANDVLYVERAPRFYIYGEVQRPGPFRLERAMTVLQALSAGGGLTPRGTERGLTIKRRDANGKQQVIDAKQDDLVQNDDVVYIKESLF
ncbi:polysaccharide export protein EpsE [Duganella sp. CY15W]|uniref:polysaccharide export protein EpsE n=1 Tax=Duganella sp. CY15W TaxID=2692172 RepID=UPI00136C9F7E|nr:polysaccharide export protein EpsE [Duganella sp. CY15W]MYM32518.1 polysaccharide export protein EpsE [Duganella sp. CY15W]